MPASTLSEVDFTLHVTISTIRPQSQVAQCPSITHDVNLAHSAEFICGCVVQAMQSGMKTVVLVQLKN